MPAISRQWAIACVDTNDVVRVWSQEGVALSKFEVDDAIGLLEIVLATDLSVCVGNSEGAIRVYDGRTGRVRARWKAHREDLTLALGRTGDEIVSAGKEGRIRFWDLKGRERVVGGRRDLGPVEDLALAGSTTLLATYKSGHVVLWDTNSSRRLAGIAESKPANAVTLDRQKRKAFVGFGDGMIRAYSLPALKETAAWQGHGASIMAMERLGGGRMVSAGGAWLRLWKPPGQLQKILRDHRTWIIDLAVAPDRSWFISGGKSSLPRVWDTATGKARAAWEIGHVNSIESLAISDSGQWVAAGHYDGFVTIWDARTGRPDRKFRAHDGPVTGMVFDGDGHFYTVGGYSSMDGHWTLKAWSIAARKAIGVIPIEGGPTCLIRDGRTLWVGCHDSTICRYKIARAD